MRPKTLLHVFPTFAVGGAQTRFTAIANHLGDDARHVVVSLDGRLIDIASIRMAEALIEKANAMSGA